MWHHLEYMINRHQPQPVAAVQAGREQYPIAIRRARDSDTPLLHDLAEVDSAAPLAGPVLVAVVEGRIWAALAVELLRLRVTQLRSAESRPRRSLRPRWGAGRARA